MFLLAALWLLHCHEYPRAAFEVNLAGTFNVLEAVIRNHVPRLVYSSSASVYGDAVTEPMAEDHPFNNTNFYGATKVAGEQMCRSLYNRYKDTDSRFDYAGLRYMNVYGPRQDYNGAYIAVIMKMLDRLDQGLAPQVYGDGSQSYDFVFVGRLRPGQRPGHEGPDHGQLLQRGHRHQDLPYKELAELVLELTGSDQQIEYLPGGLTFVRNRVGCPQKGRVRNRLQGPGGPETGVGPAHRVAPTTTRSRWLPAVEPPSRIPMTPHTTHPAQHRPEGQGHGSGRAGFRPPYRGARGQGHWKGRVRDFLGCGFCLALTSCTTGLENRAPGPGRRAGGRSGGP